MARILIPDGGAAATTAGASTGHTIGSSLSSLASAVSRGANIVQQFKGLPAAPKAAASGGGFWAVVGGATALLGVALPLIKLALESSERRELRRLESADRSFERLRRRPVVQRADFSPTHTLCDDVEGVCHDAIIEVGPDGGRRARLRDGRVVKSCSEGPDGSLSCVLSGRAMTGRRLQ